VRSYGARSKLTTPCTQGRIRGRARAPLMPPRTRRSAGTRQGRRDQDENAGINAPHGRSPAAAPRPYYILPPDWDQEERAGLAAEKDQERQARERIIAEELTGSPNTLGSPRSSPRGSGRVRERANGPEVASKIGARSAVDATTPAGSKPHCSAALRRAFRRQHACRLRLKRTRADDRFEEAQGSRTIALVLESRVLGYPESPAGSDCWGRNIEDVYPPGDAALACGRA
jgi:hypothetical protein